MATLVERLFSLSNYGGLLAKCEVIWLLPSSLKLEIASLTMAIYGTTDICIPKTL